jgi:hypothetical protein
MMARLICAGLKLVKKNRAIHNVAIQEAGRRVGIGYLLTCIQHRFFDGRNLNKLTQLCQQKTTFSFVLRMIFVHNRQGGIRKRIDLL